ncbi:MAG: tRNA ((37)-N6)-threonylcarbamoyltransferase complex ATPase subunit type 1 TsaE [Verrucomicrobiales bacterium]|nr:tRNA ((37)-N6)-threonylcarbamoyltransferase complex ATPase subunit type 1 TsaE [Verrucomicrobiales bacterium]
MKSVLTRSIEETQAVGEAWAQQARAGWIIGLRGDLGAGKTQLVKGLARGLGITEKISSPTFALVNEYQSGRLPLFHLDLYRLDLRAQIVTAGLEDYFYQFRGVTVAEWIERWIGDATAQASMPAKENFRLVTIEQMSENERRISYEDFGS